MTSPPDKEIALERRGREGARLASPSAARNREAIAQALSELLPPETRVLEIASGTGEHALACVIARPDLSWRPSDPDPTSRASADAWAEDGRGRIGACLDLDVTRAGWSEGVDEIDALFCANMIHIAPWSAAVGLFEGAARIPSLGTVHLYGPFLEGDATAPSNLEFDASLKRRDPSWGVRALSQVDALASRCGFARVERRAMPANNLLLSYRRGGP